MKKEHISRHLLRHRGLGLDLRCEEMIMGLNGKTFQCGNLLHGMEGFPDADEAYHEAIRQKWIVTEHYVFCPTCRQKKGSC